MVAWYDRQSLENVLNLQIGQYFLNTLYIYNIHLVTNLSQSLSLLSNTNIVLVLFESNCSLQLKENKTDYSAQSAEWHTTQVVLFIIIYYNVLLFIIIYYYLLLFIIIYYYIF